jgi:RNA polymerase sigma-70 factor (ECF subfamily)
MTMEANRPRAMSNALSDSLATWHSDAFGWAIICCHRNRVLAEEVLQMTYVEILEGRARFDGRSSFKTWLFGVIRRIAAGERRRAWLSASHLARFARLRPAPDAAGNPELALVADRETSRLLRAFARLSARQKEILHLVFYQEMSIEEAATVLRMRLGTARVHYERGKRRLKALLSEEVLR